MEPSPVAKRKLSPKEKRQQDRDRFLTFTKEQEEMMGDEDQEMEATLTQSRVARLDDKGGFRQSARALDDDRFRTRTITKDELPSPSSSPEKQTSSSSSSSRSSKQRRADEASRFLTQTIGPGDLVRREEEEESMTAAALESEALRVVASLSELKAGRSRSQSAEILGESEMRDSREDLCRTREASRELDSRGSSRGGRVGDRSQSPADGEGGSAEKARPRVCKPWESRVQEQEVSSPLNVKQISLESAETIKKDRLKNIAKHIFTL